MRITVSDNVTKMTLKLPQALQEEIKQAVLERRKRLSDQVKQRNSTSATIIPAKEEETKRNVRSGVPKETKDESNHKNSQELLFEIDALEREELLLELKEVKAGMRSIVSEMKELRHDLNCLRADVATLVEANTIFCQKMREAGTSDMYRHPAPTITGYNFFSTSGPLRGTENNSNAISSLFSKSLVLHQDAEVVVDSQSNSMIQNPMTTNRTTPFASLTIGSPPPNEIGAGKASSPANMVASSGIANTTRLTPPVASDHHLLGAAATPLALTPGNIKVPFGGVTPPPLDWQSRIPTSTGSGLVGSQAPLHFSASGSSPYSGTINGSPAICTAQPISQGFAKSCWQPTSDHDDGLLIFLQSIAAMPEYAAFSPEELRTFDYNQNEGERRLATRNGLGANRTASSLETSQSMAFSDKSFPSLFHTATNSSPDTALRQSSTHIDSNPATFAAAPRNSSLLRWPTSMPNSSLPPFGACRSSIDGNFIPPPALTPFGPTVTSPFGEKLFPESPAPTPPLGEKNRVFHHWPVPLSEEERILASADNMANKLEQLAIFFDQDQQPTIRPADAPYDNFWDGSRYASALRLFATILRRPEAFPFIEKMDDERLIQAGNPPFSHVIKHPLCFRDIASSLFVNLDGDETDEVPISQDGCLPIRNLSSWNMWRGMDFLQAIDLVFLNSLAYSQGNEVGKAEHRARTNKIRKMFWDGIASIIATNIGDDDDRRRQCTPTKRSESSGFVIHRFQER